jgi:L-asparaginase II
MTNPDLVEVTRGDIVESRHCGAFVVSDHTGKVVRSAGDIARPVFPRSAVKAFQCVPLLESGAADHAGLNDEELALCCASHGGEAEHVRVARSILHKSDLSETCYECGAHWPTTRHAANELVKNRQAPTAIHNNCSGKHAGMLTLAQHINADLAGYSTLRHTVQQRVAATMSDFCDVDLKKSPVGIDGCSVPTWAVPLTNLAKGFARLASPDHSAGQRIIAAVRSHPYMVAGTNRFDTRVMQALPRLFVKFGAEGVYCGCIPHAGLGFSLKVDDGAMRAAEVAIAGTLSQLHVWTSAEQQILTGFASQNLANWRSFEVGAVRAISP